MKLSLIATIVVLPILLLSCGIPEDSKPVSVVSPLIDRTEIQVDEVQSTSTTPSAST